MYKEIQLTDQFLNELKEMTDNNQHAERLIKVSQFFSQYDDGFKKYETIFLHLKAITDTMGYMNNDLFNFRCLIATKMDARIGGLFGKDIERQILQH